MRAPTVHMPADPAVLWAIGVWTVFAVVLLALGWWLWRERR